ncbi:MAG: flagellar basal body P-ring protein FlgI [Nitrospiraceae bacterium]
MVPAGAIVEQEVVVDIDTWESVASVLLRHPDFTTAIRATKRSTPGLWEGIGGSGERRDGEGDARNTFRGRVVGGNCHDGRLDVSVDVAAKVVNERTGTVVLGNTSACRPARSPRQSHHLGEKHPQCLAASGSRRPVRAQGQTTVTRCAGRG